MPQQERKWVFRELVKERDNPEQLIAYAMYKAKKDELAEKKRLEGCSEVEIERHLEAYHSQVLAVDLDTFREKAKSVISDLVETAFTDVSEPFQAQIAANKRQHDREIDDLKSEHQKKVKELNKQIANAKRQAVKEYTSKIQAYILNQEKGLKTYCLSFGKWLLSGIPGLLATVFTTFIIVGFLSLLPSNKENRNQMINSGLKGLVDLVAPEDTVDLPNLTPPPTAAQKPASK